MKSALRAPDAPVANHTIKEVPTVRPFCAFMESATLLAVARVPTATGIVDLLILCDKGAQLALVRHSAAQRLGAGPGFQWILQIQVVGEELRDFHICLYNIHLKDKA